MSVAVSDASAPLDETPALNVVKSARPYLEVLGRIHADLQPAGYLEFGVRHGASLALARCPAVGVDPEPEITVALPPSASIVRSTSDDFFRAGEHDAGPLRLDLAFIDGMHLAEVALRDFIGIERIAHDATLVVIDDVLPNHPRQATRTRETRVWTGDVWKLVGCLRRWRADLVLTLVDVAPGGFLLVSQLDPQNSVLRDRYGAIERELLAAGGQPPVDVLERRGALDPDSVVLRELIRELVLRRERSNPPG